MVQKKKSTRSNPTLHGLLVALDYSGTVVRSLLFVLLMAALLLFGAASASDYSATSALLTLLLVGGGFILYDMLYILLARLHRSSHILDRVVLLTSETLITIGIFASVVVVGTVAINFLGVLCVLGAALFVVLGIRFGLILARN